MSLPSLRWSLTGLLFVASLTSCILPPGEGWVPIELNVQAVFESDGRIQENGRFKTSKNYEIEFGSVELLGLGFRLEALAAAQGLVVFDPQNPPEGYSLCHNGHCHSASGELVDYEDIQEELNLASGASGLALFQELLGPINFQEFGATSSQTLELGPCNDTYQVCDIGQDNQLTNVLFEPTRIVLSFKVFHPEYLPEDGLDVDQSLEFKTPVSLTLDADSGSVNTAIPLQLVLQKSIWDSIEFKNALTEEPSSTSWDESLLLALLQTALLENLKLSQI